MSLYTVYRVEHDGFEGIAIGSYITLEGKEGVVLQQINTRVVHVYSRRWLAPTEFEYDADSRRVARKTG